MSVSPRALEMDMAAVDRLKAMLGNDPDIKLLLDMIEGQTGALEKMDRFVERIIADRALEARARARAARLKKRSDILRATVLAMIEKFGVPRVERDLYTASVGHKAKVEITDQKAIPDDFLRVTANTRAIGKALRNGEKVEGAVLGNPAPYLLIVGEGAEPEEDEE